MPLYEYQCDACDHRFEIIQKYSDPPADTCPACGGAVRKLLSSPAIQFKGSGWYITDYAKSGANGSSGKDAKGKTEGRSDEGKPDVKADKASSTTSDASSSNPGSGGSGSAKSTDS